MAIKIKNQQSGRTIIVKNQDDMFDLKKTGLNKSFTSGKALPDQDFNKTDDESKNDYINRFAVDSETNAPINPTRDPYYDFGDKDDNTEEFDFTGFEADPSELNDEESPFNIDDSEFEGDEPIEGESNEVGDANDPNSDPNYQGQIRSVTGANLVYKRQVQDGSYDELWIYSIGKDMVAEFAIRKAILSGTDIDPNTLDSDDGTQRAKSKSIGNIQFISISGLPQ